MLNITSIKGRLRGQQGFTLLELLIVLLIIGILIAIGLYRYQSVVDAANAQEAKAQVRAAYINISADELSGGTVTLTGALGDGLNGVAVTNTTAVGSANNTVYTVDGDGDNWAVGKDNGTDVTCMGTVGGNVVSGTMAGGDATNLTCDGQIVRTGA